MVEKVKSYDLSRGWTSWKQHLISNRLRVVRKVCEGEAVRARKDAIKIRNQLRSCVSVGPTTRRERMGGFQEQGAMLLGV